MAGSSIGPWPASYYVDPEVCYLLRLSRKYNKDHRGIELRNAFRETLGVQNLTFIPPGERFLALERVENVLEAACA